MAYTFNPLTGNLDYYETSSGGSGSPGSPAGSIQFNNAGAFGGNANLVWNSVYGAAHAYPNNDWSDGGSGLFPVILAQSDPAFNQTGTPIGLFLDGNTFKFTDPTGLYAADLKVGLITAGSMNVSALGGNSLSVATLNNNMYQNFKVELNGALSIRQDEFGGVPNIQTGFWAWTSVWFTTTAESSFTNGQSTVNPRVSIALLNSPVLNSRVYFGSFKRFSSISFSLIGTSPSSGAVTWEYFNGTVWTSTGIVDTTNGMRQDGTLTLPTIQVRTVSDVTNYWVRATVTTAYNTAPNGRFQISGTLGLDPTTDESNVGLLTKATGAAYSTSGLTIPTAGVIHGIIAPKHFIGDFVNYGLDRTANARYRVTSDGSIITLGGATLGAALRFGPGSYISGQARAYTDAANGLVITGQAGSSYDYAFANQTGVIWLANPTGTNNLSVLLGSIIANQAVEAGSYVDINGGAYAASKFRLYYSGTLGSTITARTGSTNDFSVIAANGFTLITNPTGTRDVTIPNGRLTASAGFTATGTISLPTASLPLGVISQSAATTGQVAQWNGTAWVPATVSAGGSDPFYWAAPITYFY
jgi:hypothetical protein